ncbi:PAS domain S-box protein [Dehalococcoides mccartyi]|nr:PAS domain S-box protein [Dehalococcoides mccartyi]
MVDPKNHIDSGSGEADQLADEQRRIAEIGRIVGSTLDIGEIYPQLAKQARNLVSADRMVISVFSDDEYELIDQFIDGMSIEGSVPNFRHYIKRDEQYEQLFLKHLPFLAIGEDLQKYQNDSELENERRKIGLKSLLIVPLIWQQKAFGVVSFRAFDPEAFGTHAVELAQQIANQIAGAIASSNQYAELERKSLERERLSEIRRIAGSTLNIDEIFSAFASQTRKLVSVDRLVLTTIDMDGMLIDQHIDGIAIHSQNSPNISLPLRKNVLERITGENAIFVRNGEDYERYIVGEPEEIARYAAGLRSMLTIPLVWRGDLVGSLTFRSSDPEAYSSQDIEIARQIADQIASAVHASNQFKLLENESHQREQLAEIGRIASSALDLDKIFTALAVTASKLVQFDRLAILEIDAPNLKVLSAHVAGQVIDEEFGSAPIPFDLSIVPKDVLIEQRVFIADSKSLSEIANTDTRDVNRVLIAVGLTSAMFVPVVLQGTTVGVLIFRSKLNDPYHNVEAGLGEQIAALIAGVIASSQQRKLIQAESTERHRLAEEQTRIAEIGRIVSSTLDLDEVFSRFVDEARELVPFDRLVVSLNDPDGITATDVFVSGETDSRDGAGIAFKISHGIKESVFHNNKVLVANENEFKTIAETVQGEDDKYRFGYRSLLIAPLTWQSEVVGTLIFRSRDPNPYGDREVDLAGQISAQIAGAVVGSNQYRLLQESENNYRDLVESGHILVWRMDTDGRYTYVNKAMESALGYTTGQMIGSRFVEFIPEVHRASVFELFEQRSSDHGNFIGERIYLTKDGSDIWLAYSSYSIFDGDGIFIGARGTALDVTAERDAQDELRVQATALEEASDAVVVLRPDTTIGYVNNAFVEQMGYSKKEIIGKPWSFLRPSTNPDVTYKNIWEVVKKGNIWHGTILSVRKNGEPITIDESINPVFADDGTISSFVSIRRDVTERVQAENDRQARAELDAQNQQLQEISEQREEFFSTVSHELRTPLTAVTAFSDILSRNRDGNLTDGQLNQLDIIRRNSRSLIKLVEDMLDMSLVNSRLHRIDKLPVEIDEIVNSTVESLDPTIRERNQKIVVKSNTKGIWVNADRGRIAQVLSNLITNASKYSPRNTSIEIYTESDEESLQITVCDFGYGMSENELKMVFSPFYRSDRDEIRAQAGTGLGMSISKTLVELHDGNIEVESELNVGTTVRVRLPNVIPEPKQ